MTSIVAISAGLQIPSSTRLLIDRMAEEVRNLSSQSVELEIIDLRDYAHDLVDNLLTGFASQRLDALKERIVAADGVIAATPIFSQSFSGLFKTFLDVLDQKALVNKPVFLGATAGTVRHSLALEFAVRPVFAYFRATVAPTAVFAASDDWGATDGKTDELQHRIRRGAQEFVDLVGNGKLTPTTQIDEFHSPDFADLLRAGGIDPKQ